MGGSKAGIFLSTKKYQCLYVGPSAQKNIQNGTSHRSEQTNVTGISHKMDICNDTYPISAVQDSMIYTQFLSFESLPKRVKRLEATQKLDSNNVDLSRTTGAASSTTESSFIIAVEDISEHRLGLQGVFQDRHALRKSSHIRNVRRAY